MPVDGTSYEEGQSVTVLGNTGDLVKTGYSFIYWNTASDGKGINYTEGQRFIMGTLNVNLFARWTAKPVYKVEYNGNGNTGGSAPIDGTSYEEG